MQIEQTGEYRALFKLYQGDRDGVVDIREFFLGMWTLSALKFLTFIMTCRCWPSCGNSAGLNNYTETSREDKVKFAFNLFDDDRNGFITEDELINILKANHMVCEDSKFFMATTVNLWLKCYVYGFSDVGHYGPEESGDDIKAGGQRRQRQS